jgi:DNA-binding transcriptional MocR family regulator
MAKKSKNTELSHVRIHRYMMKTAAWQNLSAVARALYVEVANRYFGSNNGQIAHSVRQAASALKVSKDTANRAFEELQKRGFIAVQRKTGFNLKERKGQATEWRLTEFPFGSDASGTKEFTRWSPGDDFPVSKGQKPNHRRTPATVEGDSHQASPLVNYKRPTEGTTSAEKSSVESLEKDQNVASAQHQSQDKDRQVPVTGPEVSPQGPSSEAASGGIS